MSGKYTPQRWAMPKKERNMEIIINRKKYSNDNQDALAVEIAEGCNDAQVMFTFGKAHNIYFSSGGLEKTLDKNQKAQICSLASQCYLKDCTEVGEIRFYDAIVTLINNGHKLSELEEMGTWDLIELCEDEGGLRC